VSVFIRVVTKKAKIIEQYKSEYWSTQTSCIL